MKRIEVFRIIGSVIWVIIVAIPANAQVKMTEGNVDALKSQKKVNVEFTYDNLSVGKVKNGDIKDKKTEADYVAEIVAEKSKKDTGKGSEWAKAWWMTERKYLSLTSLNFFRRPVTWRLEVSMMQSTPSSTRLIFLIRASRMGPFLAAERLQSLPTYGSWKQPTRAR